MAIEQLDVAAVLAQFKKDHRYIGSHWQELLDQRPERWVVVYGEEVVGEGPTLPEALEDARPKCPVEHAAVEFITHEPPILLL